MAKTGIGLLDQGFEALEEGAKQAVQGVGQQLSTSAKNAATQVTGSDYTVRQGTTEEVTVKTANTAVDSQATQVDAQPMKPSDIDNQDMLKALYGASQQSPPGQPQQSSAEMQMQAKTTEEAELAKTRQRIEQEKAQKYQQQHNEVYFDPLNKPEAKAGQKEESQQEKVEREKAEEEKKKQMELEEKQKKDEKVKAPSKNSAEHERKLGG